MVENICGQGFAYAREVEEDRQKKLVKLGLHATERETSGDGIIRSPEPISPLPFISVTHGVALRIKAKLNLPIGQAS
jgi:hypothetical protein